MTFRALCVSEKEDGKFERAVVQRNIDDLPEGDVLIRVHYSSLNYKDAMSATGNRGITKNYPHTPGIDAAGIVEISRSELFATGDKVIVTGHDLGMNTPGGYGEYIRVPASWIVPLPNAYTLSEAMVIGTAGFTAALALVKMEMLGMKPDDKYPMVVTGATGGVGSLAVSILSKAGYDVTAVTGKNDVAEYLEFLGSKTIKTRDYVQDTFDKKLLKPMWKGAIDTVGGSTLSTLLKGCCNEGSVASTGLVSSPDLNITVYPFILNGINLIGVGSAGTTDELRRKVWEKLNKEWLIQDKLKTIGKMISLDDLRTNYIESILAGKMIGRTVVSLID